MTIFAGIITVESDGVIPATHAGKITAALSRDSRDHPQVFASRGFHAAHIDVGAYTGSAVWKDDSGATTGMLGDPLFDLPGRELTRSRTEDLKLLHESMLREDFECLSLNRDAFAAFHFDPAQHRLVLIPDKISLRPVFYYANAEFIVFASALRIMEELDFVPGGIDIRGFGEIAATGLALDDRTGYTLIKKTRAAECMIFQAGKQTRRKYWHPDRTPVDPRPAAELACEAAAIFRESISLRNRGATDALSFLSGGLDSRLIVAELRQQGVSTRTFNFGAVGSQDSWCAKAFAQAAGTDHLEKPQPVGFFYPNPAKLLAASPETPELDRWSTARGSAHRVWHGYDGSMNVGYVNMHESVMGRLRKGDISSAVDEWIRMGHFAWGGVRRVLNPQFADVAAVALREGMIEHAQKWKHQDAATALYHFYATQCSPRLVADDMEDVDLHRIEYVLPFADYKLFEFMLSVSPDFCFRHSFYMRMVASLTPLIQAVPWQTYPGHIPCNLPMPASLAKQWEQPEATIHYRYRRGDANLLQLIRSGAFWRPGVRPVRLLMLAILHRCRFRNYDYHFQRLLAFTRYSRHATPAVIRAGHRQRVQV